VRAEKTKERERERKKASRRGIDDCRLLLVQSSERMGREKKGGQTDAKLTISNISYQREKELIDERVCL
jgi:hypothetical protein